MLKVSPTTNASAVAASSCAAVGSSRIMCSELPMAFEFEAPILRVASTVVSALRERGRLDDRAVAVNDEVVSELTAARIVHAEGVLDESPEGNRHAGVLEDDELERLGLLGGDVAVRQRSPR